MSGLALWSVIDIVALIAGLAVYLFIVGKQLKAVAADLEEAADLVWKIKADAELIEPGLKSINTTGRVVAGALPLLYGLVEALTMIEDRNAAQIEADERGESWLARHGFKIAAALMAGGRTADDPVTIVSNASMPHQEVASTTLGGAGAFVEAKEPPTPAIVVVGRAADWRSLLDWYKGPLRENPVG